LPAGGQRYRVQLSDYRRREWPAVSASASASKRTRRPLAFGTAGRGGGNDGEGGRFGPGRRAAKACSVRQTPYAGPAHGGFRAADVRGKRRSIGTAHAAHT
ncbi:hypothetical protein ACTHSL_13375, partial [Neisseria sp. P0008.S010]|uniref:hypothetical protein n=1 Tax=Neisseria sp. P0008.S010 TaxID=3436707 RepID=UPI003F7EE692